MILLGLLACVRAPVAPPPDLMQETAWAPPELAGRVDAGRYTDATYGFSLPVPEGWSAQPAAVTDATRLVLVDAAGLARLRVEVVTDPAPAPRADCAWDFDDTAVVGGVSVRRSTCVPIAVDGPRVLSWTAVGATPMVRLEAEVPQGSLMATEDAAASVLAGLTPGAQ